MKQFVIAGSCTYGVKNAGDDAMLANLTRGLRQKYPDCRLTFLARHPNPEFDKVFGVDSIKNIDHDNLKQSEGRWFFGFNPGDPTGHLARIREAIHACDLLILGGNSFMEVSSNDFLRGVASYPASLAMLAKWLQRPYALYGVAAHRLEHAYTQQVARFLCANATSVTVRETYARLRLIEAGVDPANIHVVVDPVYGLDADKNRQSALNILARENIRLHHGPVVGIGFRHMYWQWDEHAFNEYAAKMATICDNMIDNLGAELLFIPNCTYGVDRPYEDDRIVVQSIREKIQNTDKTHFIQGDYHVFQTLSLFQFLDMHVSNRRHSCIFAALHGVPVVPMNAANHWHFDPFVEDLQVRDNHVSITHDDIDTILTTIHATWQNRAKLSKHLLERVPILREKAGAYVDILTAALD